MKKPNLTQRRNKYIREQQAKVRKFIIEAEKKGYMVSDKILEAVNAGPVKSKKQYDELKTRLNLRNVKKHTTYAIPTFKKQVSINGNYKYDVEQLVDKANHHIKTAISSGISYEQMEKIKSSPDASAEVADIVNDLIDEQRRGFKSADAQLVKSIWDIAVKLNSGSQPTGATANFSLESFYDEETGDWVEYQYDPNDVEQSMRDFYKAVRFKKVDDGLWHRVEQDILSHPQTNKELYEYYMKKASDRSFDTNQQNLFNRLGSNLGISGSAVRTLTDLMNTSEIWNIAKLGTYDSDQVLDNWEHIYVDLMQLEKVKGTVNTQIDELRRDIMNGANLNVKEIKDRTEKILKARGEEYKNNESFYYNKGASTRWFKRHKDQRRSGSKYKKKK